MPFEFRKDPRFSPPPPTLCFRFPKIVKRVPAYVIRGGSCFCAADCFYRFISPAAVPSLSTDLDFCSCSSGRPSPATKLGSMVSSSPKLLANQETTAALEGPPLSLCCQPFYFCARCGVTSRQHFDAFSLDICLDPFNNFFHGRESPFSRIFTFPVRSRFLPCYEAFLPHWPALAMSFR